MDLKDIDRAASDGSLDKAELPLLQQYRQVLDGHSNAGDASFQRVRNALRNRVAELIKTREAEQLQIRGVESEQKRHSEIAELQKKAIQVSEEANRISVEANMISCGAKESAKTATWIALGALVLSVVQLFLNLHSSPARANQIEPLALPQPKIELSTPPTNISPSSISTNTTTTNSIPPKTPQGQ